MLNSAARTHVSTTTSLADSAVRCCRQSKTALLRRCYALRLYMVAAAACDMNRRPSYCSFRYRNLLIYFGSMPNRIEHLELAFALSRLKLHRFRHCEAHH